MTLREMFRSFSVRRNRRSGGKVLPVSVIESLEERIVPATLVSPYLVTFLDTDGDKVTVASSKPIFKADTVNEMFQFDRGFVNRSNALHQQLQGIKLRIPGVHAAGVNLMIRATHSRTGDGFVRVGSIDAQSIDLGWVWVDGDLGRIVAGDANVKTPGLRELSVDSLGRFGTTTQASGGSLQSVISGELTDLIVATSVVYASVRTEHGGDVGKIQIGQSLMGGAGFGSGQIWADGDIRNVNVGNISGGSGENSGSIRSEGTINNVLVKQNIAGGEGKNSGTLFSHLATNVILINGDVRGGGGERSGRISSDEGLRHVTVKGSLIGGSNTGTGGIESSGAIGVVRIGKDIRGGRVSSESEFVTSGFILGDRIKTVIVSGSIYSGSHLTGSNTKIQSVIASGAILAQQEIRSAIVEGSLVGNENQSVLIAAVGARIPIGIVPFFGIAVPPIVAATHLLGANWLSAKRDEAIGNIRVRGNVLWSEINAGNISKKGINADARIDSIDVGGTWTASIISAGAVSSNGDRGGLFSGLGALIHGPEVKDTPSLYSQIGSVRIGGTILASKSGKSSGILAESIGSIRIAGRSVKLQNGVRNDTMSIGPGGALVVDENLTTTVWGDALTFGRINLSQNQDGTTQQPTLNLSGSSYNLTEGMTFATWFQATGAGVLLNSPLTDTSTSANRVYSSPLVYIDPTGNLVAGLYDPTPSSLTSGQTILSPVLPSVGPASNGPAIGAAYPMTSANQVIDGNWHHVAFVASASSQSLYLDGMLVGMSTPQYHQVKTNLTTPTVTLDKPPSANQVITGSVWQQNIDGQTLGNLTQIAKYQIALAADGSVGQTSVVAISDNLIPSANHAKVSGVKYDSATQKITLTLSGSTVASTTPLTVYANYQVDNGQFSFTPQKPTWSSGSATAPDFSMGTLYVGGTVVAEPLTASYPTFNYPQGFVGAVDDLALWGASLPQSSVQAAMSGPLSGQPSLQVGLKQYFAFDGDFSNDAPVTADYYAIPKGNVVKPALSSSTVPIDSFDDLPRLPGYQNWGLKLMTPLASSNIVLQMSTTVSYAVSLMANDQLELKLPNSPLGSLKATITDSDGNTDTVQISAGSTQVLAVSQTGAYKLTLTWTPTSLNANTDLTCTALPGILNSIPGLMSTFTTPTPNGPTIAYAYSDPDLPGILTSSQIAAGAGPANYWPLWTNHTYFLTTTAYSPSDLNTAYKTLVSASINLGGPTDFGNISGQSIVDPSDLQAFLSRAYQSAYGQSPPTAPSGNQPFFVRAESNSQDAVYKFLYNANLLRTTVYNFIGPNGSTSPSLHSWVQNVIQSIITNNITKTIADQIAAGQTGQEASTVTIATPSSKVSQGRLWEKMAITVGVGVLTGGTGFAMTFLGEEGASLIASRVAFSTGIAGIGATIGQSYLNNAIASDPSSETYNVDISQITNGTLSYLNLDTMQSSITSSMEQVWTSVLNSLDDSFVQKVMSNYGLLKTLQSVSAEALGDPDVANPDEAVHEHLTQAAWSQMIPGTFTWQPLPADSYPTADAHASNPQAFNVSNSLTPISLPNPANSSTAVSGTYDVAVGDFNADGKQDFVATNAGSNNFSVGLGDGTGNFSLSTYWVDTVNGKGSTQPEGVEVADFDGDGNLDMVIAIHGINSGALVYWGDGTGSNWTNYTRVNFNYGPQGLAIADFNQDGSPDFAAACNSATVVLVTYAGNRTFNIASSWYEGGNPARLAATTYNGKVLLAVAAGSHYFAYEIDPTTLIRQIVNSDSASNQCFGIAWGNFDWTLGSATEDGIPDLAISDTKDTDFFGDEKNTTSVTVSLGFLLAPTVYASQVGRLFSFGKSKYTYFQGLTSVSVSGDPRSYLVVADNRSSELLMMSGLESYSRFATNLVNMQGGTGMNEVAVADFNSDGIPELISANNGSHNISIVPLTGTGGEINGYPGSARAITTFAAGGLSGTVSSGVPVALSTVLTAGQTQQTIGQIVALQSGNAVTMPSGYQVRVPGTFVTANAASYSGKSGSYLTAWNLYDNNGHPIALSTAQSLFGDFGAGNEVQPVNPNSPLSAINGAWFMPIRPLSGGVTTPAEAFFSWGQSSPNYNNGGVPTPTNLPNGSGDASGVTFAPIKDLPPALEQTGVTSDGITFSSTGGIDQTGNAYSGTLLGSTVTVGGIQYAIRPADQPNILRAFGQTIAFPKAAGKNTLNLLAASVNAFAGQLNQQLVLNFTDGTSSPVIQSFSDLITPKNYAGESTSAALSYYNTATGGRVLTRNYVYSYSFRIPQGKTLASLTLPNNKNLVILSVQLK